MRQIKSAKALAQRIKTNQRSAEQMAAAAAKSAAAKRARAAAVGGARGAGQSSPDASVFGGRPERVNGGAKSVANPDSAGRAPASRAPAERIANSSASARKAQSSGEAAVDGSAGKSVANPDSAADSAAVAKFAADVANLSRKKIGKPLAQLLAERAAGSKPYGPTAAELAQRAAKAAANPDATDATDKSDDRPRPAPPPHPPYPSAEIIAESTKITDQATAEELAEHPNHELLLLPDGERLWISRSAYRRRKRMINDLHLGPYRAQQAAFDALMRECGTSSVDFGAFCARIGEIYPDIDGYIDAQMLGALGCEMTLLEGNEVFLPTRTRSLKEQRFCIVDIEASGNNTREGQIIEIGALMWQNGRVLGEFSSLIYAPEVPEVITELTGIDARMLASAPPLRTVLERFRGFLGDAIFVAHGVHFDFNFIARSSMEQLGAPLLNRRLDTLTLARKHIQSERFSLEALREVLGLQSVAHRAFGDAQAAAAVLAECLGKLPRRATAEDLLQGRV